MPCRLVQSLQIEHHAKKTPVSKQRFPNVFQKNGPLQGCWPPGGSIHNIVWRHCAEKFSGADDVSDRDANRLDI